MTVELKISTIQMLELLIGIHDEGEKHNPYYHKSSDRPATLNIEYLTSITKLILATILELDKSN